MGRLSRFLENLRTFWFFYALGMVTLGISGLCVYCAIAHPCIERKDWVHEVVVCTRPGVHVCMEYEKIMKHDDVCVRYR